MGQFIEDIILFAIFFYIAKKILRIVYTFLTGNNSADPKASGPGSSGPFTGAGSRRPEGSIDIKFAPEKKKSTVSDNEGTFIDYEEIKPKQS